MSVIEVYENPEYQEQIISYSAFFSNENKEKILSEELFLADELATYLVDEYIQLFMNSSDILEKEFAVEKLKEWMERDLHLDQIFIINRLAINEEDLKVKRMLIDLLKHLKNKGSTFTH